MCVYQEEEGSDKCITVTVTVTTHNFNFINHPSSHTQPPFKKPTYVPIGQHRLRPLPPNLPPHDIDALPVRRPDQEDGRGGGEGGGEGQVLDVGQGALVGGDRVTRVGLEKEAAGAVELVWEGG